MAGNAKITTYSPVLCFGTFFILLCQARKNLGTGIIDRAAHNREVTETEVFNALMRVVFGDDNYSANSGDVGVYKRCERTQKVPCQNATVLKEFNLKYENYDKYKVILNDTSAKLIQLLDPRKDEWLVKSVLVLLKTAVCDNEGTPLIDDGSDNRTTSIVEFSVSATERRKLWTLLNESNTICLPYFLLDVYRYIMNNCNDNREGLETYNKWCPKPKGAEKGALRPFIAEFDKSMIKGKLTILRDTPTQTNQKCVGEVDESEANWEINDEYINGERTTFEQEEPYVKEETTNSINPIQYVQNVVQNGYSNVNVGFQLNIK